MQRILVMAAAAIMAAVSALAQTKRSDDFRARYELKEVVVMSRHNIHNVNKFLFFHPISNCNYGYSGRLRPLTKVKYVKLQSLRPHKYLTIPNSVKSFMGFAEVTFRSESHRGTESPVR